MLTTFFNNLSGQNNFVFDSVLYTKLKGHLKNDGNKYYNKRGREIKDYDGYKNVAITSSILSTDSVIQNKSRLGLYRYRYADFDAETHLYFNHPDSLEFITKPKTTHEMIELIKKLTIYFDKYKIPQTNQFHTIKELADLAEYYVDPPHCWDD